MKHYVTSKAIKYVAYSRKNHTLEVQFTNGNIYLYQNVSRHLADKIRKSEHPGSTFWHTVRANVVKHPYQQLEVK